MKCNQTHCPQPAKFRFTWPGQKEKYICALHVVQLRGISAAMGLDLEVLPLEEETNVEEKEETSG